MKSRHALRQTSEDNYVSECGFTMQREYGRTPNGNLLGGRWVLRKEGEFVDFDQYRNDLAERNNMTIAGEVHARSDR
ncbi:hypothetical protein [Burkholderia gladioli]|uniref:hypothetical protein n=1 Tax=Burkholderia gladioli TaxID=28095 RepID=UPI001641F437|nr:hypothetical protein [Burkholderia gladioli]